MKTFLERYQSHWKTDGQQNKSGFTYRLGKPLVYHWFLLGIVTLLLLIGAFFHIALLVVITVFVLVLGGVSWLLSIYSMKRLAYKLTLSRNRAFPDETIELNFEVGNEKAFFVPCLQVETELSHRLMTGRLRSPSPYTKERMCWTTSISSRQRIIWKETIKCLARGEYEMGPSRLRSGDLFGLFPRKTVLPTSETLIVYPRIIPIDKLSLALKELVGPKQAPRNFYEDASRTIGSRDYRRDDPFKYIHWKASARSDQLQTRQFESTTSLSLFVIFDVSSFCSGVINEELFEFAISTVASLAYEVCRQDFPAGLAANSQPPINLPVASGNNQLLTILESLARVEARPGELLVHYINRHRLNLPLSATLLVVTNDLSAGVVSLAQELERKGHSLILVNVGRKSPPNHIGDISVVSIRAPQNENSDQAVSP